MQGPFRVMGMPPGVHRGRRQTAGRLLFGGDTALLPSWTCSVTPVLIQRIQDTVCYAACADDNVGRVGETDLVIVPSRPHHVHPSVLVLKLADVKSFDQNRPWK